MFWCRDIGLAKRLLGYSVWLLGSGLAAANHDAPKSVWCINQPPSLYDVLMQRYRSCKRLLGYSVWLLGSGWAASNHHTPKASCQCEWYKPTPTPLWHSEWKIPLWILVAKVLEMVARAWPVSVELIQDWLLACCPESNEPTFMFYDTSILRYPFDLSMEVYGTCC